MEKTELTLHQLLFPILQGHWKNVLIGMLATMFTTAIITLFLPNYYKANCIFYPKSDQLMQFVAEPNQANLPYFGNDQVADRLIALAYSIDLRNDLVGKFNLYQHYNINPSSRNAQHNVYAKLSKNIDVLRTDQGAIEISIEDQNPQQALDMLNFFISSINTAYKKIISSENKVMLSRVEEELKQKENELTNITKELTKLRKKFGVFDTKSQGEGLAILQEKAVKGSSISNQIENYTAGVSKISELETVQINLSEIVAKEKSTLIKLKAHSEKSSSVLHMIQRAQKPMYKSRPQRSLICLGSGVLFLICSILLLSARYNIINS